MTINEKREMERFLLELPVIITWTCKDKKSNSIEQMTSDISACGAFFKTQKSLLIGTNVKIIIMLSLDKFHNLESKASYISVSGSVTRTDQQGMAICFDKKFRISPSRVSLADELWPSPPH